MNRIIKIIVTVGVLTSCILHQTAFGQFGIIADKDGFVNVRDSPKISNNIKDTLTNGQIVFCFEPEGQWLNVDYHLNEEQTNSGYIHKSRVKFIKDFNEIPCGKRTDSAITFQKDSIKILITKTDFDPKNNELEYRKEYYSENEIGWLEKINGKEIWGTDGSIPRNQYGEIILTLGKSKIHLPIDNLFEPNLDDTTVNIDEENKIIYVSANNSDAAGAYAVLWIVENGEFKQRITTITF